MSASPLQHFGYWPGSVDAVDSLEEHAGICNVTKVINVGWNANANAWFDPRGEFERARAAGLQVLMNLPEGDDRLRLAEWAAIIQPFADQILAFFTMDEPDCVSHGSAARLATLLAQIETDIRDIQTHFPGARTMMTLGCFTALMPRIGFRIPTGLTDVAIQAYHGRAQWHAWITRLTPYLAPAQRLWLMPYVAPFDGPDYLPKTDADVIFEARTIYEYAKTDTRVVGLLPFMWYDGARDRPAVRDELARIGLEILARQVPAPADTALRLTHVIPAKVLAGEPFALALLGTHFAPRARAQYAVGDGPFRDFPAAVVNPTTLTLQAPAVPPGTYRVRVTNPDGEATHALPVRVTECGR
jgi:hypothetical protein